MTQFYVILNLSRQCKMSIDFNIFEILKCSLFVNTFNIEFCSKAWRVYSIKNDQDKIIIMIRVHLNGMNNEEKQFS